MNRPTIPQLEAFFWTAELGSVQKAADRLNVTQPTLSLRLKQLELELPLPVLERHGRSLKLTREGHTLLGHARIVLDAYQELGKSSVAADIAGVLRIGLAEGFAVACMPVLIAALESDFPLMRPEWTVGTSAGLEQALVDSNLDVAVLVDPVGLRDVRLSALGLQKNLWAAPEKLHKKLKGTPCDLAQYTVITTPPPTAMYRATIGWFAEEKISPERVCICSSLNAALQLVAAGLGLGIFPAKMIECYPSVGAIKPLLSIPPVADGRVFVADRGTSDLARTAALIRTFERATGSIAYFSA
jgi:DNA-binding transcriptional LysR family regulator